MTEPGMTFSIGTSYSVRGFVRNLLPTGPVFGKPRLMGPAQSHPVSGAHSKACLGRAAPLLAGMPVGMAVGGPVRMGVRLDHDVGRHQHDAAVAHAALGDHVLGEMLHLVRSCRAGSSPPCSCHGRDARASRRATIRGGRGRCRPAAWRAAAHCGRRHRPAPPRSRDACRCVSAACRMPARARSRIASERFW